MTDRTDHVIDSIDRALGDYSVSADAMRWATEEPTDPPWPGLRVPVARAAQYVPITAEQMVAAFRGLRPFFEAIDELARHFGLQMVEFQRALINDRRAGEPSLAEIKARALRLRQHRNTGPSRDVTRQRRPRRHTD